MFFKVLSRFKKVFRSKKSKKFCRFKRIFWFKKNVDKKFRRNEVKYCDFRHFWKNIG